MKVPRLAAQSLNRWLAEIHRPNAVSLVACAAALFAALAGCQSQQTNSGDPFLPFGRTRVPPPGTNVPADSYYQGAPASSAPPASMPPPAGAPPAAPGATRPPDIYSPPGGYNIPQSSIDRSKVIDPATNEVRAGGTAIARRRLANPAQGQATVDTQLTAGKVTAGAAGATAGAQQTAPADSLATTTPNSPPSDRALAEARVDATADSSADASAETEMTEAQASSGAALAFGETPNAENNETTDEATQHGEADRHTPLASAGQWSAGADAPEQTLAANASTLRILAADEPDSREGRSGDDDSDAKNAGEIASTDSDAARQTDPNDDANATATTADRNHYAVSTVGGELSQAVAWNHPAQATPIDSAEPTDQTTTLAMAQSPSGVVPTNWTEPAAASPVSGAGRSGAATARANQAYGYDPSYGWLRGRLEYSASQQQWKLRYIPIDGTTDQFGGSVVLADGAPIQGLRAGDFVTAQGRVVGPSQPSRGFSPRYEVAAIEPVAGSH